MKLFSMQKIFPSSKEKKDVTALLNTFFTESLPKLGSNLYFLLGVNCKKEYPFHSYFTVKFFK